MPDAALVFHDLRCGGSRLKCLLFTTIVRLFKASLCLGLLFCLYVSKFFLAQKCCFPVSCKQVMGALLPMFKQWLIGLQGNVVVKLQVWCVVVHIIYGRHKYISTDISIDCDDCMSRPTPPVTAIRWLSCGVLSALLQICPACLPGHIFLAAAAGP